ncbi:MAG TPA: oligosaccharide flippase family protein [Clostridiaceae bacterium]|nr:oligosaccharide flippase family protein [Clostridiaceae bacterium]
MNTKELSLKQNILWNSGGSIFYQMMQYLISYSVARFLGLASGGIFLLCLSVGTNVLSFSLYGVRPYQVSDVASEFSDRVYIVARIVSSTLAILGCVFYLLFSISSVYTMLCVLAYAMFKVAEAYIDVYHGIIQRSMRMDIVGKSLLLRGTISSALFFLVVWLTKSLLWSIVAMSLATFILAFIYDHRRVKLFCDENKSFARQDVLRLLRICFPLAICGFLATFIASFPRILLHQMMGETLAGIYLAVVIPAAVIQALATYVFAPMLTVFAKHMNQRDFASYYKLFMKIMLFIAALSIVAIAGGALLAEWGLVLLFGEKLREYAYLLVPVLLISSLTAVSWFLGSLLTVIREIRGFIVSSILAVAVSLAGGQYSIRTFGLNGASFILIVALVVQIVSMSIFMINKNNKLKRELTSGTTTAEP